MLLVRHTEALLLVNDEQSEIFEFNILLQKPVRADNKVALAGFEVIERFCCLRRSSEAAEHLNGHGEAEKPLQRGLIMLLGKHRCRNENGRLAVIQNALHNSAQSDLRFSVADIAAQQSVHGNTRFHIRFNFAYAPELIVGLRVAEVILKFPLPRGVPGKGMTRHP